MIVLAYHAAIFGLGAYVGYANGSVVKTRVTIHTHKSLDDIPEPRAIESVKVKFLWGQWGKETINTRELDQKEIQEYINN